MPDSNSLPNTSQGSGRQLTWAEDVNASGEFIADPFSVPSPDGELRTWTVPVSHGGPDQAFFHVLQPTSAMRATSGTKTRRHEPASTSTRPAPSELRRQKVGEYWRNRLPDDFKCRVNIFAMTTTQQVSPTVGAFEGGLQGERPGKGDDDEPHGPQSTPRSKRRRYAIQQTPRPLAAKLSDAFDHSGPFHSARSYDRHRTDFPALDESHGNNRPREQIWDDLQSTARPLPAFEGSMYSTTPALRAAAECTHSSAFIGDLPAASVYADRSRGSGWLQAPRRQTFRPASSGQGSALPTSASVPYTGGWTPINARAQMQVEDREEGGIRTAGQQGHCSHDGALSSEPEQEGSGVTHKSFCTSGTVHTSKHRMSIHSILS